jgi:hypothetical protein
MFREAVKDDTFLAQYLSYMDPLETPVAYDFWCGLWLLSSAVARNMRVERPHAPVFMNVYAILCADAGTTRKSSAIRRCEAVYRKAGLDNQAAIITGSCSPEALTAELLMRTATDLPANANILVSELVTFLGKEHYTMGMPGLLTDLYDCPDIRDVKRVSSENMAIRDIFVSFLAASTPSWLVRAINPDVIEGGFTSRCLFIIEEKRKRVVAWPDPSAGADYVSTCVNSLRRIQEDVRRYSNRGITLTDNAKAEFVRWYEGRRSDTHDPFTTSFEAREDHHVLRLAGLLAVNDRSFIIDVFHIRHAVRIIKHHKDGATDLFGADRDSHKLVNGVDRLRLLLANAGAAGLSQNEISYKVRNALRSRELEYALTIMNELEMVSRFEVKTHGRAKTIWRGTNKLLVRSLQQTVLERMKYE